MGYLDGSTIVVDAILTKRGREILSSGTNNFNITMFALADDEIDYALWNPEHTLGANYYGEAIEHLPILEAITDEMLTMRSQLVSLPPGAAYPSTVFVSPTSFVIPQGASVILVPGTDPATNQYYIATISNRTYFSLTTEGPLPPEGNWGNYSAGGYRFKVTSLNTSQESKFCTIFISGVETGGSVVVTGEALGQTTIG